MPPRYATPRNESRQSTGAGVVKVARALRMPLMPWQVYVATVAGEVWPRGTVIDGEDVSGQYVYSKVLVTVQRQAGKSALMLAKKVHRCLARPDQQTWFTAQTGKDATDLYKAFLPKVQTSQLAPYILGKPAMRGGSEAVTWTTGSMMRPFAPGRDALHGKQSDDVDVDEGWAFSEAEGADLLQAIAPTKATRPGAQTWIWSTRGDAGSAWFHDQLDKAMAGQTDPEEGAVAVFDWGIPDDAAVDMDTIVAHHPAVGHTQTRGTIRAGIVEIGWDKPTEVARAYGNRASGGKERVIPEAAWEAARVGAELDAELAGSTPAYGIAVWEPRDGGDVTGALVAARRTLDGVPVVELVEHRPGRAWLTPRVLELRDRGQGIAVDRKGPAGTVADALELAGVELLALTGTDVASASQDLRDRLADRDATDRCEDAELRQLGRLRSAACCDRHGPRVLHRSDPRLDAAADVAGRRFIGEGAWVFSARESTGDVAALQAMTLAVRALDHAPAQLVVGRSVFAA